MQASIVIRALNEARHIDDLLRMIARQRTRDLDVETVVIDSGSTDGTVEIARSHGARITHITKGEFSFGRSLNRGCAFARGDVLVFISGHCVPEGENWLQALCQPILDGQASYTYGRQIGDDDSNFSERRIFSKYFPELSAIPQAGFFCNNANSAIARSIWQKHLFDEELTGLEDMDLGKRLVASGGIVGYVADAIVFHHHQETWPQIRRRFEREALALRSIMPEVNLSVFDIARCIMSSAIGDWRAARRAGVSTTSAADMFRYRWNQYLGSYKGNHEHRRLSRRAKERFFYPELPQKADHDEWLRPLRRASSNEIQQSEG